MPQRPELPRSEFRRDPIRGHWTIIAPERGRRPNATKIASPVDPVDPTDDPFLAGNEHLTPVELFAVRPDADTADWSTRVVTNRYPAVYSDEAGTENADDLFQTRPGTGQHEVIVECPHFESELANLPASQIADVLTAWQSRLNTVRAAHVFDYVLIFKNSGAAAGTSLPHSHSQMFATSAVPQTVIDELDRAAKFHAEHGDALQDVVIKHERDAGRGVLEENDLVAFCPFASRFTSEAWIAPSGAALPAFHLLSSQQLSDMASMLHRLLNAILKTHPGAAYNLLLHSSPLTHCEQPWFRWRLEICPRLAGIAGLELATQWYVNSVPPEVAAETLRVELRGLHQ